MTTPATDPNVEADQRAAQATGFDGPQLSDAGAAIAYPDTDEVPAPPPASTDFDTTPFAQRPGKLMDLIRAAAKDWPANVQALIDFPYVTPKPRSTQPFNSAEWWDETENAEVQPDSFHELEMATAYGMLTREQFNEVHAGVWARSGTAAGERQPASGQDTDTAGSAAAERQNVLTSTQPTTGAGSALPTPADLGD